jgi:glucose-6-phosphate 1-dehydrogenase
MRTILSDALVLFGATGDLAYKQTYQALQATIENRDSFAPMNTCSSSPTVSCPGLR